MGGPRKISRGMKSLEPMLFAAHITFVNYDDDAPLAELSETFELPKDEIEVLQVSLYEKVFALWIHRPELCQSHEAIKALIRSMESLYSVRKCIIQQQSIYFVNSADECIEVSCTRKEHLPDFKGVHVGDETLKFYAGRDHDAWCFICYDTQNPFKEFSCRTAQRYWKRSYGIDGSWVCTVHSEEVVRKGCHQFTTLSKMFKEFGEPRQFFMLVTKAFDNTYPYLLHAPGQSISDPDADQPPAFCYQIVSDPTVGHGYVSWDKVSESDFNDSETSLSSASSDDFWSDPAQTPDRNLTKRRSLSFW